MKFLKMIKVSDKSLRIAKIYTVNSKEFCVAVCIGTYN